MVYNRAPAKNCVASFCGKRRNNGAKIAFGFTRKHWSKVCFDDIARYAFGLPNADFASRLVEETPFPQTPSAMEGQNNLWRYLYRTDKKKKTVRLHIQGDGRRKRID